MSASKKENIGIAADKDLTLAPQYFGLNVDYLLRAVWAWRIKWSLTSARTTLGLSWDRSSALVPVLIMLLTVGPQRV